MFEKRLKPWLSFEWILKIAETLHKTEQNITDKWSLSLGVTTEPDRSHEIGQVFKIVEGSWERQA